MNPNGDHLDLSALLKAVEQYEDQAFRRHSVGACVAVWVTVSVLVWLGIIAIAMRGC